MPNPNANPNSSSGTLTTMTPDKARRFHALRKLGETETTNMKNMKYNTVKSKPPTKVFFAKSGPNEGSNASSEKGNYCRINWIQARENK